MGEIGDLFNYVHRLYMGSKRYIEEMKDLFDYVAWIYRESNGYIGAIRGI